MKQARKPKYEQPQSESVQEPGVTRDEKLRAISKLLRQQPDYIYAAKLTNLTWLKGIGSIGGMVLSVTALLLWRTLPLEHWLIRLLFGIAGTGALAAGYHLLRYRRLRATLPDPLPETIRHYQKIHTYLWLATVLGVVLSNGIFLGGGGLFFFLLDHSEFQFPIWGFSMLAVVMLVLPASGFVGFLYYT